MLLVSSQRKSPNFLTGPAQRTQLSTKSRNNFTPHIQSVIDRRMVESEARPLKMSLVNRFPQSSLRNTELIESASNLISIFNQYIRAHRDPTYR